MACIATLGETYTSQAEREQEEQRRTAVQQATENMQANRFEAHLPSSKTNMIRVRLADEKRHKATTSRHNGGSGSGSGKSGDNDPEGRGHNKYSRGEEYGPGRPHDRTASVLAGAGQSTRDTGGETRVNSQLRDTHAHQGRGYRGDNTHTGRRHGAKGAMKSQGMSPARMTRNATRWGARNSEDLLR
jgi:hypothetical protein